MKSKLRTLPKNKYPVLFILLSLPLIAHAGAVNTIWGDSAGDSLDEWNLSTGAQLMHIDPSSALGLNGDWNGRGVVQVNNTLYVTSADSNNVYMINATTGAGEGIAFSVAGTNSLSVISFDGTNFWIADYSGTNKAYLYSHTGTLIKTISLSNATAYMDGLLYFNNGTGGQLISNRYDGCCTNPSYYDTYDLNGTAKITPLITANTNSTGIAFDGSNFWASDIFHGTLAEYNGTTGAFMSSLALQDSLGGSFLIEGVSVNYTAVLPPPTVPEPGTLALLGLGLGAVAFSRRLRKRQ